MGDGPFGDYYRIRLFPGTEFLVKTGSVGKGYFACKREVAGSNPVYPPILMGIVAQLDRALNVPFPLVLRSLRRGLRASAPIHE